MKLKTDLDPLIAYGGISKYAMDLDAETHDAAAAHALMIAMDEQQLIAYRLAVAAIKRRAAEILAE